MVSHPGAGQPLMSLAVHQGSNSMAAIPWPLDQSFGQVCDWAPPWPNCLREDPQCGVTFLTYKEVEVLCHIRQP